VSDIPAKPKVHDASLLIRMPMPLRRILERIAEAEDRPVSALARKVLADYAKRNGKEGDGR
jgi:predicted transcriptional regulator